MNGDKAAPAIEIELGGKKRQLIFDMWAFLLLERETGKNVLNGETFRNLSVTDMVVLIWAGLQAEKEKLTIEQVGRMMTFESIPLITEVITKAFNNASVSIETAKKTDAGAITGQ